MERTIKTLHNAAFPVYQIESEPIKVDGLVFSGGYIIDDQNIPAKTLGERRLLTPHPLFKLRTHRGDIVEVIKGSRTTAPWYIDNLGSTFSYRKSTVERLVCHKILDVVRKDFYSLILVEGVNFPIVVKRPPVGQYAQLLYYKDLPWKLYNILYEPVKPTRKKV